MKKKGFTLMELLAVLVVVGILALVAIPILVNVIKNARLSQLKNNAYGLVDSAGIYYAKNSIHVEEQEGVLFTIDDHIMTSTEKLSYKGDINHGGLYLNTEGKTSVCIDDNKYYATKTFEQSEVETGKGTCGEFDEDENKFYIYKPGSSQKEDPYEIINRLNQQLSEKKSQITELNNTISSLNSDMSNLRNLIAGAIRARGYNVANGSDNSTLSNGISSAT